MKKLLLIAAATAALSTSALAAEVVTTNQVVTTDEIVIPESTKSGFYIRGDVGAYLNTTQKFDHGVKYKGKAAPSLDLGVGYYVNDQFRMETVYTHLFNPEVKYSDSETDVFGNTHSGNIKIKAKVDAVMVNGIFDAYDFGAGKLFLGAGIGWAQVSEKITAVDTTNGASENVNDKMKKKSNFAYNLMAGSSFKLADGVNLDIKYKWADYGTAKHTKDDDSVDNDKKLHRRGNAINIGIRFDI